MKLTTRKSLVDAKSTGKYRLYPDGSITYTVASVPMFGEHMERADKWQKEPRQPRSGSDVPRAQARARSALKDIALCTPFKYFVTLTLDQTKCDRYDMSEITKKLNNWLDNCVRRKGLTYVLVPERHKDGAVHFHGFFNDALDVIDSGKRTKDKRKIYNLPAWTLGFTTAIELYGDYHQAVSYVIKYIGKTQEKIGGRWYYSGGDTRRPVVGYMDTEMSEILAMDGVYRWDVPGVACFAQVTIRPKGVYDNDGTARPDQSGVSGRTAATAAGVGTPERERSGACEASSRTTCGTIAGVPESPSGSIEAAGTGAGTATMEAAGLCGDDENIERCCAVGSGLHSGGAAYCDLFGNPIEAADGS